MSCVGEALRLCLEVAGDLPGYAKAERSGGGKAKSGTKAQKRYEFATGKMAKEP